MATTVEVAQAVKDNEKETSSEEPVGITTEVGTKVEEEKETKETKEEVMKGENKETADEEEKKVTDETDGPSSSVAEEEEITDMEATAKEVPVEGTDEA